MIKTFPKVAEHKNYKGLSFLEKDDVTEPPKAIRSVFSSETGFAI